MDCRRQHRRRAEGKDAMIAFQCTKTGQFVARMPIGRDYEFARYWQARCPTRQRMRTGFAGLISAWINSARSPIPAESIIPRMIYRNFRAKN